MELLHPEEVWRRIPPEEKLEILAKTHAKALLNAGIFLLVAVTLAIGLRFHVIIWGALCGSPLVFQFAAARWWRRLRPKAILEYLAARSAARRFAFSANGKDLTVQLIFRGTLAVEKAEIDAMPSFETAADRVREAAVWVALLSDTVVMLSEGSEGANLEMARHIDEKLEIQGESDPNESSYSSSRRVHFTYRDVKKRMDVRCTLRSPYPAALVVFEKRLVELHEEAKQAALKRKGLLDDAKGVNALGASDDNSGYVAF